MLSDLTLKFFARMFYGFCEHFLSGEVIKFDVKHLNHIVTVEESLLWSVCCVVFRSCFLSLKFLIS